MPPERVFWMKEGARVGVRAYNRPLPPRACFGMKEGARGLVRAYIRPLHPRDLLTVYACSKSAAIPSHSSRTFQLEAGS